MVGAVWVAVLRLGGWFRLWLVFLLLMACWVVGGWVLLLVVRLGCLVVPWVVWVIVLRVLFTGLACLVVVGLLAVWVASARLGLVLISIRRSKGGGVLSKSRLG